MEPVAGTRCKKSGSWGQALAILRSGNSREFTTAWLMKRGGLTRRQAWNAIMYARLHGLVERIGRGRYVTTGAQAA